MTTSVVRVALTSWGCAEGIAGALAILTPGPSVALAALRVLRGRQDRFQGQSPLGLGRPDLPDKHRGDGGLSQETVTRSAARLAI